MISSKNIFFEKKNFYRSSNLIEEKHRTRIWQREENDDALELELATVLSITCSILSSVHVPSILLARGFHGGSMLEHLLSKSSVVQCFSPQTLKALRQPHTSATIPISSDSKSFVPNTVGWLCTFSSSFCGQSRNSCQCQPHHRRRIRSSSLVHVFYLFTNWRTLACQRMSIYTNCLTKALTEDWRHDYRSYGTATVTIVFNFVLGKKIKFARI